MFKLFFAFFLIFTTLIDADLHNCKNAEEEISHITSTHHQVNYGGNGKNETGDEGDQQQLSVEVECELYLEHKFMVKVDLENSSSNSLKNYYKNQFNKDLFIHEIFTPPKV